MSNAELPKSVDPYRLADKGSQIEGLLPVSGLERFAACVAEPVGECEVLLSFGRDEERRYIVSGQLSARVHLECQRCLQVMQSQLRSEFRLGLVISDEQAQRLPKSLEPLLVEDQRVDLWSLVEDELILVLPPFPLHERGDCPATDTLDAIAADSEKAAAQPAEERQNPFQVLAGLKKGK